MHRLAVLHHDEVRDVDQVVDGADAEVGKAALHPSGRRSQLDVRADCCDISCAEVLRLDVHGDVVGGILLALVLYRDDRGNELVSKGNRCLPCDAEHAVAVDTVGGDLILKVGVMKAEGLDRIGAELQLPCLILREDIDAVLRCLGVHLPCCTELLDAAHHADRGEASHLAGLDPDAVLRHRAAVVAAGYLPAVQAGGDDVAFFEVLGARHDLDAVLFGAVQAVGLLRVAVLVIGRSDVDRADPQVIRIRVMGDGIHSSDNDLLAVAVEPCPVLDLGPGERHPVIIFLVRARKIRHVVLDP